MSNPSLKDLPAPNVPYFTPYTNPPAGSLLSSEIYPQNKAKPLLFEPVTVGPFTLKNRLGVAPMCQYSAASQGPQIGSPTDWHLVNLGTLASRGASIVMAEATAVQPNGRISPQDLGLWSDDQIPGFKKIVDFIHSQGAVAAIQLAHAGRKASTAAPWLVEGPYRKNLLSHVVPKEEGGWPDEVIGPDGGEGARFNDGYPTPIALTEEGIEQVVQDFESAAKRAVAAGFDVIEIHGAHGYLISSFLSPLSNTRTDRWGGPLENRIRLAVEISKRLRHVLGPSKGLFFRVSATEWDSRGERGSDGSWQSWGIEQTVHLARELQKVGVDLLHVSTGGNYHFQKIPIRPGFQVEFAERVKKEVEGLKIGTVGLITTGSQAEEILKEGKADVIFMAREWLRNADIVTEAAKELGVAVAVAHQYQIQKL